MAESFVSTSCIGRVNLFVIGDEENKRDACAEVTNNELFKYGVPVANGLSDPHMGTLAEWTCETCLEHKGTCPGHPGIINLKYPVKNPHFREHIPFWLKIICFRCGKLIVKDELKVPKRQLMKAYEVASKKIYRCQHCDFVHPTVQRQKNEKSTIRIKNEETEKVTYLHNNEIYDILNSISDETLTKLGRKPQAHPRKFILHTIRVPPNTARPDVRQLFDSKLSDADITSLLKFIVKTNSALPDVIPKSAEINDQLEKEYMLLDLAYYVLVRGSSSANDQLKLLSNTNTIPNSLANRIRGKAGRIRDNLTGKRVRMMIRSVITGDNYIAVDEIGVPLEVATALTIPERVTPYNKDRLMIYFNNRDKNYPGCSAIVDNDTHERVNIKYLDPTYILKVGDVIYRHIIDGDVVGFNRQPSLIYEGITCHKVRILPNSKTLRLNLSACDLYHADFDGDCMNAIVAQNIQAINELSKLISIDNWFMSFKNGTTAIGAHQDAIIGTAEMTRSDVKMNKWHAMSMMSKVTTPTKPLVFDKKEYTGRDVLSYIIPNVMFRGKPPTIFMEQYSSFIHYDPDDIKVEIVNGYLKSGILDKAAIGAGSNSSLLYIIAREHGTKAVLDFIHSLQQMTEQFMLYKGFSTGIGDLVISENARMQISKNASILMERSREITKQLHTGELVPSLGMDIKSFYEMMQLNVLEPGDSFVQPILRDIDFSSNGLARLIFTGSKGKPSHMVSINGSIGSQKVMEQRAQQVLGYARTSPYFLRWDLEPTAMGYIPTSYREGIPPQIYSFAANEKQDALANNALSTSVTGAQNRHCVKNMETLITNNLRSVASYSNVVQPLYCDTGVDPRSLEKIKIPTILASDAEFAKMRSSDPDPEIQKDLDDEFKQLEKDRDWYRATFMKSERNNLGFNIVTDSCQCPVHFQRLLDHSKGSLMSSSSSSSSSKAMKLDVKKCIKLLKMFLSTVAYAFFNETWEHDERDIPDYINESLSMFKMAARYHFSIANLKKVGISTRGFDIVLKECKYRLKKSLIDYGLSIGILVAQCISQPLTQYMLDSKHRVGGGGGSSSSTIVRVKELTGTGLKEHIHNPFMLLAVREEYETDKTKVQQIVNKIEMMNFDRFVDSTEVFFEQYGNPIYPAYKDEKKLISQFEKLNLGLEMPNDISMWCVRYELDKEKMINSSMQLETIIRVLRYKFPLVFFVYTPENAKKIIIRAYIRSPFLREKSSDPGTDESAVKAIASSIKNTTISGLDGIKGAKVIDKPIPQSYKAPDGSIKTKQIYLIETVGSNFEQAISHPDIDPLRSHTDSLIEFMSIYGIEATRQKIIYELQKTMPDNDLRIHYGVCADTMCSTGFITNFQRVGLSKRETKNTLLLLSYQSPIEVLEDAAINCASDVVRSMSSNMLVGRPSDTGTRYNRVIIDEKAIEKYNSKSMKTLTEEL